MASPQAPTAGPEAFIRLLKGQNFCKLVIHLAQEQSLHG
jgi:hypothetical protein